MPTICELDNPRLRFRKHVHNNDNEENKTNDLKGKRKSKWPGETEGKKVRGGVQLQPITPLNHGVQHFAYADVLIRPQMLLREINQDNGVLGSGKEMICYHCGLFNI